jgi:hypothetical protein
MLDLISAKFEKRADKVIVDPGGKKEEKCKSGSASCNFERAVIFTRGIAL